MNGIKKHFLFSIFFLLISKFCYAQLIPMSTEQLIQNSSAIIVGTCDNLESRWVGKQIHTFVTIAVDESLKGSIQKEVTVKVPGGKVTKPWPIQMSVSHAPHFTIGEEVLLFLWKSPKGHYAVVGLSQGKFSIKTNTSSGEKFLDRYPGFEKKDQRKINPKEINNITFDKIPFNNVKNKLMEILK